MELQSSICAITRALQITTRAQDPDVNGGMCPPF